MLQLLEFLLGWKIEVSHLCGNRQHAEVLEYKNNYLLDLFNRKIEGN